MCGKHFLIGFIENRHGCHQLMGNINAVAILLDHVEDAVNLPSGGFQQRAYLFFICLHVSLSSLLSTPTPWGRVRMYYSIPFGKRQDSI